MRNSIAFIKKPAPRVDQWFCLRRGCGTSDHTGPPGGAVQAVIRLPAPGDHPEAGIHARLEGPRTRGRGFNTKVGAPFH